MPRRRGRRGLPAGDDCRTGSLFSVERGRLAGGAFCPHLPPGSVGTPFREPLRPALTSFRSVVDPAHCDFLGRMNVSRYFAACSDGVFALQSELGLTARDMREGRRLSFAVVHAESDIRAELSPGDVIRLETSIVEIGSRSMTFRHRLIRCEDETLAFETLFTCVLPNPETRRATALPTNLREKAAAWPGTCAAPRQKKKGGPID